MTLKHAAKILAHSITENGREILTFEVVFPRKVLAELNTHRLFSRNSASSRAIPVKKMIRMVMENPYIPTKWGKNKKGMQAVEEITPKECQEAISKWLQARDQAVTIVEQLAFPTDEGGLNIHKQIANRLLEPFMWHTAIITATEWSNFYHLRDSPMADPDIAIPAGIMRQLAYDSEPKLLKQGEWHLPLVGAEYGDSDELIEEIGVKLCTGRTARVSYLTHEGIRDPDKDVEMHDGLLANGHMSPLEHPARPMTDEELSTYRMYHYVLEGGTTLFDSREYTLKAAHKGARIADRRLTHFCGNFDGWMQYRKTIPYEFDKMARRL